jgi:putative transposase
LTIEALVTERSGVTGEKMELSDYVFLSAPKVDAYNHLGNKLSSLVAADAAEADQDTIHGISMQVASMSPIALDADHVAQEVKDKELAVAIEKTKQDEVNKAVENALRKAGINPAHADSEDHIASNTAKGWLTEEQAQLARDIRANVPAEAQAQINEKKVEIIEAEACPDHIHMLVSIPPYLSIAQFVGFLKGKSSLMIFDRHANLKYKYGNRTFWCRGYYVDTVGKNEKIIKEYIRNQLEEDYAHDQISMKEYVDPFTGAKNK